MKLIKRISENCLEVQMVSMSPRIKREPMRVYRGHTWWHVFEKLEQYEKTEKEE